MVMLLAACSYLLLSLFFQMCCLLLCGCRCCWCLLLFYAGGPCPGEHGGQNLFLSLVIEIFGMFLFVSLSRCFKESHLFVSVFLFDCVLVVKKELLGQRHSRESAISYDIKSHFFGVGCCPFFTSASS